MSTGSSIEWTEVTWNPTTGCDRVSAGCDHCYALTLAKRLKSMGAAKYQNDGDPRTSGPGFGLTVHADALSLPLRWRKPRRVFVNSMSDLFHKDVPDEFIARVFAVMAVTPRHTYQILTKRHGRMRSLLSSETFPDLVGRVLTEASPCGGMDSWPLRNVWCGVSAEDQKHADLRIPALLETPAAVRFLSCEPLLGPVDLLGEGCEDAGPAIVHTGVSYPTEYGSGIEYDCDHQVGIDWVIVGGESGPKARWMHPDWARSLRDQCQAAGVPYFLKQWGGRTPKAGGRQLDGRTWDEFPVVMTR